MMTDECVDMIVMKLTQMRLKAKRRRCLFYKHWTMLAAENKLQSWQYASIDQHFDCGTLWHVAERCVTLRRVAVRCGMLWCVAACCGTLRHVAARCGTLRGRCGEQRDVAACCGTLRRVTVRCGALRRCVTAPYGALRWCVTVMRYGALRCVAVR